MLQLVAGQGTWPGVRPQMLGVSGCHMFGGRRGFEHYIRGLLVSCHLATHSLGSSGLIGIVGRELLGEVAGGARILEVLVQVLTSMMVVLVYSFLSPWAMGLAHFADEDTDARRTKVT